MSKAIDRWPALWWRFSVPVSAGLSLLPSESHHLQGKILQGETVWVCSAAEEIIKKSHLACCLIAGR